MPRPSRPLRPRPTAFASACIVALGSSLFAQTGQSVFYNTYGSVIDPAGGGEVSANFIGSTSKSELEALADFRVINNFSGFTVNIQGGAQYIISNFAEDVPDLRFTYIQGVTNGQPVATGLYTTSSPGGAINLPNSSTSAGVPLVLRIDVGTFDQVNFLTDRSLDGLGFTLGGVFDYASGVSVEYFAAGDVLLSSQTFSSDSTTDLYAYTGHVKTTLAGITHVIVTIAGNGSAPAPRFGLDDIGFAPYTATVPEPATYATLLALAACGLAASRRKPRQA